MIKYHPKVGQIFMCDFSAGFRPPEMVKKRPVIILTPQFKGRADLVTVTPLSTKIPEPIQDYHYELPTKCLPQTGYFQKSNSWVKGDMIYTVSISRLDLIQLGKRGADGKRLYYSNKLGRERMKEIYACLLHGLNLGNLSQYL